MIRRATIEDIPAMIALQRSVEEEDALWGYGADSPEDWAKRDLEWAFLAMDGGRPVGFIYCSARPYSGECVFPVGARILEIVELVIAADHRCHGLGHELMKTTQRHAQAEGFTHLRVYSAAKRFDDIIKFYRSCGFTPWYLEMTKDI